MIIYKEAEKLSRWLAGQRKLLKSIGFAPTMGALHEGHISLIKQSKLHDDITISSIFINPTQFNNAADFEKYPVSVDDDVIALYKAGCDVVFIPSVKEIYPDGIEHAEHFELGRIENILEGEYRPGHFQGVCKVVRKLLEIVKPDILHLGQKDYQQCLVIKKLLELTGSSTVLQVAPTVREADGLAMSSRNRRLTPSQRSKAPGIFQALTYIKDNIQKKDLPSLKSDALKRLTDAGFKVDYLEIADSEDLGKANNQTPPKNLIAVAAAFLGDIRLIDNLKLK